MRSTSSISNKFIKDPAEVLKAGQIVKVKVLSADAKTKRISLSIKALLAPSFPSPKSRGGARKAEAPVLAMQDKLAALFGKWKTS